jgi:hypothetical protein
VSPRLDGGLLTGFRLMLDESALHRISSADRWLGCPTLYAGHDNSSGFSDRNENG